MFTEFTVVIKQNLSNKSNFCAYSLSLCGSQNEQYEVAQEEAFGVELPIFITLLERLHLEKNHHLLRDVMSKMNFDAN